ncbi:MAG: hypothetical protein LBS86_01390 [Treponema sp.]|nr:hypothetical protein [Treponema sp.]
MSRGLSSNTNVSSRAIRQARSGSGDRLMAALVETRSLSLPKKLTVKQVASMVRQAYQLQVEGPATGFIERGAC